MTATSFSGFGGSSVVMALLVCFMVFRTHGETKTTTLAFVTEMTPTAVSKGRPTTISADTLRGRNGFSIDKGRSSKARRLTLSASSGSSGGGNSSSSSSSSNPFFANDISSPSPTAATRTPISPRSINKINTSPLTPAQRILQGSSLSPSISTRFGGTDGSGGGFDPTPEALIAKARVVIATDLGIQDPSVLFSISDRLPTIVPTNNDDDDDDGTSQGQEQEFLWIRPLADKPLGRTDYLAAGKYFNLRGTFPNLDWRAHDFRIDINDPFTVRCTVRPVGTMTQPLRLRNQKIVPPNGKIWRGPPECISMTFDPNTGKLTKLCSEFVMDRQVGNTNGLAGVKAAATIAGVPPNDFEVFPAPVVLDRFFGRPIEPLDDPTTFLAPFPETVMITLAKGVLFANFGADDSSLLSERFTFLSPTVGPVGKSRFLTSYAADQFGDFRSEFQFSNFRVDAYDPYRVWVDVKLLGSGLEGPPLGYSFTFDDDGFCTRITGAAVLDPSVGNTGGLAGIEGIRYAFGDGSLDITTRPLPVALGRLRKTILSPLTKINADEFVLNALAKESKEKMQPVPKEDPEVVRQRIIAEAKRKIQESTSPKASNDSAVPTNVETKQSPPLEIKSIQSVPRLQLPEFEIPSFDMPSTPRPSTSKKLPSETKVKNQQQLKMDALKKKQEEARARTAALEQARTKQIEEKKRKDDERRRQAEETRKRNEQSRIELAKKNAADRRNKAEAQLKRTETQKKATAPSPKSKPSPPRPSLSLSLPRPSFQIPVSPMTPTKSTTSKPVKGQSEVKVRPSISLPRPSIPLPRKPSAAPKGVPTVVAWKVKNDGGLSGQVFGSSNFRDGQRFETSPIVTGALQNDSVVTTESGSRYFLSGKTAAQIKEEIKKTDPPLPKELLEARSGATIQLTRQAKEKAMKTAMEELDKAKSDVTISLSSLFGFDRMDENKQSSSSSTMKKKMKTGSVRKNTMAVKAPKKRDAISPPKPTPSVPKPKPPVKRPTISLSDLFGSVKPSSTSGTKPAVKSPKTPVQSSPKPKAKVTPKPKVNMMNKKVAKKGKPSKVRASPSLSTPSSPSTKDTPKVKTAPNGVPTITNWRRNNDRSVTGLIRGSKSFTDGEKVTTSPIANGVIRRGEIVVTGSGSKYFLQ